MRFAHVLPRDLRVEGGGRHPPRQPGDHRQHQDDTQRPPQFHDLAFTVDHRPMIRPDFSEVRRGGRSDKPRPICRDAAGQGIVFTNPRATAPRRSRAPRRPRSAKLWPRPRRLPTIGDHHVTPRPPRPPLLLHFPGPSSPPAAPTPRACPDARFVRRPARTGQRQQGRSRRTPPPTKPRWSKTACRFAPERAGPTTKSASSAAATGSWSRMRSSAGTASCRPKASPVSSSARTWTRKTTAPGAWSTPTRPPSTPPTSPRARPTATAPC